MNFKYVLNKQPQSNGDYEVHNMTTGCTYMPNPENQINLGIHSSCVNAVAHAKSQFSNIKINGCYFCCNPCHTS